MPKAGKKPGDSAETGMRYIQPAGYTGFCAGEIYRYKEEINLGQK